ncbi:hypothetical protein chiPu_0032578, partial [Chiloscyllium punctatum]|nr:hypothetical protein [Chiloscyllium punctatum]
LLLVVVAVVVVVLVLGTPEESERRLPRSGSVSMVRSDTNFTTDSASRRF